VLEVRDTATIIARIRAAEAELPSRKRLFEDPYAHLFADAILGSEEESLFSDAPFLREQVRLRTRFIDDVVRAALVERVRQIVILGAGFDSRALRMAEIPASGALVFEVDFALQIDRKRAILAAADVREPKYLHYVPCDFGAAAFDATLSRDLADTGFLPGAATLFIWEGVISYLEPADIERTLHWMGHGAAPGTRVVFNYRIGFGAGTLDPERLPEQIREAGFATVEDRSFAELHRSVFAEDPPDVASLFRIAVVKK
jgi:methyltransferase (TIGR00027 family)